MNSENKKKEPYLDFFFFLKNRNHITNIATIKSPNSIRNKLPPILNSIKPINNTANVIDSNNKNVIIFIPPFLIKERVNSAKNKKKELRKTLFTFAYDFK